MPRMTHFPIFIDLDDRAVAVSGAGHAAVSKLRLLLKTGARISVFGEGPDADILDWAEQGRISVFARAIEDRDVEGSTLLYCANEDAAEDARVAAIGSRHGILVNIVDNLGDSDFITPAIVDRAPVTVAIGTEGTAPVLARMLKADIEERLPQSIGEVARNGLASRPLARSLPAGKPRREFWNDYFAKKGIRSLLTSGNASKAVSAVQETSEVSQTASGNGRVFLVGAGPGDPDLLTVRARNLLHDADVVVHDQLVSDPIIEIARREATIICVGKTGFAASWKQEDINALIIDHARSGQQVVRLKSGDPTVFSRLDEETAALSAAGIEWEVVPGVTAATAAAARLGVSLTQRHRNSEVRLLTGHDVAGLREQDWRELAKPESVAAIYMSRRSARFICGRLLMHGAPGSKPVTIVQNATWPDEKIISTNVHDLASDIERGHPTGPTLLLVGLLDPRAVGLAASEVPSSSQQLQV